MRQDEIRNQALVLLMKGLLYHNVACILYHIASEKTMENNLILLIVYVPLVLFAVIRRKCGNFLMFLLLHAAISGGFLLFMGMEERVAVGGCTIWMAASSVYTRMQGKDTPEERPSIVMLAAFLLSYLAAQYNNWENLMQICCYDVFLFLILFMTYENLAGASFFLESNDKIVHLPKTQMQNINRAMLGIFLIVLTAGMLLMSVLPAGSLADGVLLLLRQLLWGLLKVILWIFSKDVPQREISQLNTEAAMPLLETGKTSALARFMERFLVTTVIVLTVAAVLYLLIRIIYQMYQKFYEKNKDTSDESEFIWKHTIVQKKVERKKRQKELFQGRNENQKIRSLFKKSIYRRFPAKTGIPSAMSVTEMERYLAKNRTDHTEPFTQTEQRIALYQKARYSQHVCSRNELEAMKQNIKKIR